MGFYGQKNIYMADKRPVNEDVIFPKKDDDGELITKKDDDGELLSKIPSDISEVGDIIRANDQKRCDDLFSKLEETFGTPPNSEEPNSCKLGNS